MLAKAVLQLEFCPSLVALAEETWMLAMRIFSQNCVLSLVLCFVGTSLVGPTMIRYLHAMLKNGFEAQSDTGSVASYSTPTAPPDS